MVAFGVAIGLVIGLVASAVFLQRRAHWLMQYQFEMVAPPVPASVLRTVREAEASYYAGQGPLKRIAEEAQDALVFASPHLVYVMNFSVGRYRIKAHTLEKILPWTIRNGYLKFEGETRHLARSAIAYFSEQPAMSDWQAATLLEWLRQDHPKLKQMSWNIISDDPQLIAKLYSGYMGAGGAWDEWRNSLKPGPEALRRLGLEPGET